MEEHTKAYIEGLYAVWAMERLDEFWIEEVDKCADWGKGYPEDSQECEDFKQGFNDAVNYIYTVYDYEKERGWEFMR